MTPIEHVIVLTRVRAEIVKQEEQRAHREALRRERTRHYYGKIAFSTLAVLVGIGMAYAGQRLEGFALMGVGFYWLAPDFVKSLYDRLLTSQGRNDGD